MRRRLLNGLTLLSLLSCLIFCVMWLRSGRRTDNIGFERVGITADAAEEDALYVYSSNGSVEVGRWRARYLDADDRSAVAAHATGGWRWFRRDTPYGFFAGLVRTPTLAERLGFGARADNTEVLDASGTRIEITRHHSLTVPYWLLILAAAMLPLARAAGRLRTFVRRRRWRAGVCPRCGYDLRATPERCPECGAAAAVSPGKP